MERNDKVKFTKEGFQEVLKSLTISGESVERVATTVSGVDTRQASQDEKEALLKEVVASMML